MKNHRHIGTDEQIEHHSLPGINMAGKQAGVKDCDSSERDDKSEHQTGQPAEPQIPKSKSPHD